MKTFRNPILPGFYPDPSICRVGDDYYLVTSSFEYFPGLPIFHSRDLTHWRQIGHVLDRLSQLNLAEIRPSGGLYAPTIRHWKGKFYVVNTLVDGKERSGNFIVTADSPEGPWSELSWLSDTDGFDPSLFFDEDGRAWYTGNRLNEQGYYTGHTEVFLRELDLEKMELIGSEYVLWDGAVKGAVWAEAAHIYKVNEYYYLLLAEGGTAHHHAVTIARSKTIMGPYEANRGNPILTHRHLGLDYPIVGTGHADMVETPAGEWWLVLLAMRPYGGYFYNLGRETFLAPVRWEEDGWPIVSPGTGRVEFCYPVPNLAEQIWPDVPARDNFENSGLALHWNFLRGPGDAFCNLSERPGYLRLRLRPQQLSDPTNPSFVGRRQQHIHFSAQLALEFSPQNELECAGLVLLQNNNFHFRFVVTQKNNELIVRLIKRENGQEQILAEEPLAAERVYLKVEGREQAYHFYAAVAPDEWRLVAQNVDGRILSTPVAGGFVGTMIAMYASSNGEQSNSNADFDWFEYTPLEEI